MDGYIDGWMNDWIDGSNKSKYVENIVTFNIIYLFQKSIFSFERTYLLSIEHIYAK